LESGIKKAKKSLEKDKKNHPDLTINDPLRDKISDLFDGKVGNQFNEKQLLDVYNKARQRFEVLKPPGFKDKKGKDFPEMYGDVVIWFQIIEFAKKEKKPLIFITDDRKEDWWQREGGQTICPRPELTHEIWSAAEVPFYMYHSDQFIKFASEFLNIGDQQSAVKEVQEIRRIDETQEIIRESYSAANFLVNAGIASVSEQNPAWLEGMATIGRNNAFNAQIAAAAGAALHQDSLSMFRELGVSAKEAVKNAAVMGFDPSIGKNLTGIYAGLGKASSPWLSAATADMNAAIAKMATPAIKDAISGIGNDIFSNYVGRSYLQSMQPFGSLRGLRGRYISREIDVEILPKYSSGLLDSKEENTVYIEARVNNIIDSELENNTDEEIETEELSENTQAFEFDNFPLTVTLIHFKNSPESFESLHKLRKPGIDEWYEWASNIIKTRRYFSEEVIKEENAKKDPDDEPISEKYESYYSELKASNNLYKKITLGIAGVLLDETDDFPINEFRDVSFELMEEHFYNFAEIVITELYECYCSKGVSDHLKTDEMLIQQKIYRQSGAFIINHVLHKPSDEESHNFRTQIIRASFSKNDENQEVVDFKLNLQIANDLYNKLLVNIENATAKGETFKEETKSLFLEEINPVYKFRILTELLSINAWNFKVDDMVL
jgi:hypothetical protein